MLVIHVAVSWHGSWGIGVNRTRCVGWKHWLGEGTDFLPSLATSVFGKPMFGGHFEQFVGLFQCRRPIGLRDRQMQIAGKLTRPTSQLLNLFQMGPNQVHGFGRAGEDPDFRFGLGETTTPHQLFGSRHPLSHLTPCLFDGTKRGMRSDMLEQGQSCLPAGCLKMIFDPLAEAGQQELLRRFHAFAHPQQPMSLFPVLPGTGPIIRRGILSSPLEQTAHDPFRQLAARKKSREIVMLEPLTGIFQAAGLQRQFAFADFESPALEHRTQAFVEEEDEWWVARSRLLAVCVQVVGWFPQE